MVVRDTDHMSLLEWGGEVSFRLRERLTECDPAEVFTTIISYEEQMRGWMAYIARARTISQQVEGYRRLRNQLENYRQIPELDFDSKAGEVLLDLKKSRRRIGIMDLKIAASCLSTEATLLSRNLKDFGDIPGLDVKDWTS
ncbi:MAG: type II toxin-antitoxin system VapC family toxin [Pirellulaceae bacterium]|nr:type II toxin-antitoxin system VapC family toxin [Pirellulaceae bacterium]